MDEKIPIHTRLGISEQRADEIIDSVVDAFQKTGSLRKMVEFVNDTYHSESVIAGMTLDGALIEAAIIEEA